MSAEKLAKLTAKMRQIDGAAFGGAPELTCQDVAGALAGTNRLGYLLLLAKYADDNSATNMLWKELADEIQAERDCGPEKAKGVALACIFPVISPMRCNHCHGRGTVYPKVKGMTVDQAAHKCHACQGSGLSELSERQKAAMAEIASTTWHESWRHYAAKKEEFLWSVESSALGRLKAQLQEAA